MRVSDLNAMCALVIDIPVPSQLASIEGSRCMHGGKTDGKQRGSAATCILSALALAGKAPGEDLRANSLAYYCRGDLYLCDLTFDLLSFYVRPLQRTDPAALRHRSRGLFLRPQSFAESSKQSREDALTTTFATLSLLEYAPAAGCAGKGPPSG
ncbi:hypothetical protein BX600DRAFT_506100 [Xylariales sp. PMI_506]|nr:hypothetical protein BX600DRAFT_506100 [Xylariales sp. PMI_506]